jgi:hypothetical protein
MTSEDCQFSTIHTTKTNASNILAKFYSKEHEFVEKLNFHENQNFLTKDGFYDYSRGKTLSKSNKENKRKTKKETSIFHKLFSSSSTYSR